MDGEEIRHAVAKPCINAEDECYNCEWSTELTVQEAFDESDEPKIAQHHDRIKEPVQQMSLFEELERSLRNELKEIDPNELTPIEALTKLDALKQLADKQSAKGS